MNASVPCVVVALSLEQEIRRSEGTLRVGAFSWGHGPPSVAVRGPLRSPGTRLRSCPPAAAAPVGVIPPVIRRSRPAGGDSRRGGSHGPKAAARNRSARVPADAARRLAPRAAARHAHRSAGSAPPSALRPAVVGWSGRADLERRDQRSPKMADAAIPDGGGVDSPPAVEFPGRPTDALPAPGSPQPTPSSVSTRRGGAIFPRREAGGPEPTSPPRRPCSRRVPNRPEHSTRFQTCRTT